MRCLLASLALFPATCWSQVPPAAPAEVSTKDAPATFSSKVSLVQVPVVVRDRDHKTIGTLKQEDFQLYDKGKLQVIAKFSLEKASAKMIPVTSMPKAGDPVAPTTADATVAAPEHF